MQKQVICCWWKSYYKTDFVCAFLLELDEEKKQNNKQNELLFIY